ncbi:LOW QUALITY PROTEIN: hypothetical protein PanWU01x14_251600 [Parasponia andersonii]|uniref:RNase H type-1 domain-containing protein n=1 Tax=Parasponia andersonii TaxID=3476 RepID=A0A2P5BCA2_PARAD|nr:LOW QUALITY PROTEIN: hypothetical protein PanWU01x14_251600 [Parasponia andersonii]
MAIHGYFGTTRISGAMTKGNSSPFCVSLALQKQAEFCSTPLVSSVQTPKTKRWSCPSPPRYKLNLDAAIMEAGCRIGLGGIVRHHMGEVLAAFCFSVQCSYEPEIASKFNVPAGLKCRSHGFKGISVA